MSFQMKYLKSRQRRKIMFPAMKEQGRYKTKSAAIN